MGKGLLIFSSISVFVIQVMLVLICTKIENGGTNLNWHHIALAEVTLFFMWLSALGIFLATELKINKP